ncbi:MAG: hypothetical protein WBV77_06345 [Solirubrobacteraceae bacterium]
MRLGWPGEAAVAAPAAVCDVAVLSCSASCPDAFGVLPELGVAVDVGAAAAGLGMGIGAGVGPATPPGVPALPEVDGGVGEARGAADGAEEGEVPELPEAAVTGEASGPVDAVAGDAPELAYTAIEGEDAVTGEVPRSREDPVADAGIVPGEASRLSADVVADAGAGAPAGDDEGTEDVRAPIAKVESGAPAGAEVSPDGRTTAVRASGVDVSVSGAGTAAVVETVEAASEPGVTDAGVAGPISPVAAAAPLPATLAAPGAT